MNDNKIQKLPNELLYEILLKTFHNGELITFLNFRKINKYLYTISENLLIKEIYNKNINEIINTIYKKKELTNDFTKLLKILNYYEIYIILLDSKNFDYEDTDDVFKTRCIFEYTDKNNTISYSSDEKNIFCEFTLIKINNIDKNNKLYINVFCFLHNETHKRNEIFISIGYNSRDIYDPEFYINSKIETILKAVYNEHEDIKISDIINFVEYFSKYIINMKKFKILYNQKNFLEINNKFKIKKYKNFVNHKDELRYTNSNYQKEYNRLGDFNNRLYNFSKSINFDIEKKEFL
jgi:hypothetical protein